MLQNYNKILTKVPYSQLYQNKTQIKISTKKKSAYFTHPDFSAAKIEKKCANYACKYGFCFLDQRACIAQNFNKCLAFSLDCKYVNILRPENSILLNVSRYMSQWRYIHSIIRRYPQSTMLRSQLACSSVRREYMLMSQQMYQSLKSLVEYVFYQLSK